MLYLQQCRPTIMEYNHLSFMNEFTICDAVVIVNFLWHVEQDCQNYLGTGHVATLAADPLIAASHNRSSYLLSGAKVNVHL